MKMATQVEPKLSAQLESGREGPGDGDVLHSVRTKRERHRDRDMQNAGNLHSDMVTNHTGKERGRPTHLVFQHEVFS